MKKVLKIYFALYVTDWISMFLVCLVCGSIYGWHTEMSEWSETWFVWSIMASMLFIPMLLITYWEDIIEWIKE